MAKLASLLRTNVLRPIRHNLVKPARDAVGRVVLEQSVKNAYYDPRITYPCYKSFDDLIDSARLKSLDAYVTDRIEAHKQEKAKQDESFYSGLLTLKADHPKKPGSRIIYLAKKKQPGGNYLDLDKADLWTPAEAADEFPLLMDFIRTLPFKSTARMMIMYDDTGKLVTPHRDHCVAKICHEFIWFRTNLTKPFYMLNPKTGVKRYVESYSAWFDSVNQFHGADPHEGMSFSIRVDGTFTDEFRKLIPKPHRNAASAPALWACTS
jgi:hypothetical protein